jgi:hypothetical protein
VSSFGFLEIFASFYFESGAKPFCALRRRFDLRYPTLKKTTQNSHAIYLNELAEVLKANPRVLSQRENHLNKQTELSELQPNTKTDFSEVQP